VLSHCAVAVTSAVKIYEPPAEYVLELICHPTNLKAEVLVGKVESRVTVAP
jgi:hypothetical protein